MRAGVITIHGGMMSTNRANCDRMASCVRRAGHGGACINPPALVGLCPGEHLQHFYMPLEPGDSTRCPVAGCDEQMVVYVMQDALAANRHWLRCEFCGRFMRPDGKGHEACQREYDRSVNPNG